MRGSIRIYFYLVTTPIPSDTRSPGAFLVDILYYFIYPEKVMVHAHNKEQARGT